MGTKIMSLLLLICFLLFVLRKPIHLTYWTLALFLYLFNSPADIKKHTSDDNPDKRTLERAIEALKEVMT